MISWRKSQPSGQALQQTTFFTVRDESLAKPMTVQLLFLSAGVQRDSQPAMAFLTTRVRCPDEYEWGKVKRLIGYMNGTLNMPLNPDADCLTLSRWWVDAAYAVHDDCRWHTGVGMSFGRGEWQ
jgi:hypothetical protein